MSSIPDAEMLYRRVMNGSGDYVRTADGFRISTQAFSDRQFRPSVDQASLCTGPSWTQDGPDNGVLRLTAEGVRAIRFTKNNQKGVVLVAYDVDVHPDPIPASPPIRANPAHAEIRAEPAIESSSTFRKLLERLALLARWEIHPLELRGPNPAGDDAPGILSQAK